MPRLQRSMFIPTAQPGPLAQALTFCAFGAALPPVGSFRYDHRLLSRSPSGCPLDTSYTIPIDKRALCKYFCLAFLDLHWKKGSNDVISKSQIEPPNYRRSFLVFVAS